MSCSSCGASRGHLGGCPAGEGGKPSPGKRKKISHKHDYRLMRKTEKGGTTYYFWRCLNAGCPSPDQLTIGDPHPPN